MKVAVDFDGTCVDHCYPAVGADAPACVKVLKMLVESGHNILLFTMRSGVHLEDAVNWFADRDIPLYGINTDPDQLQWTSSPKCFAHMYIDDRGVGVPMLEKDDFNAPVVDWYRVNQILNLS